MTRRIAENLIDKSITATVKTSKGVYEASKTLATGTTRYASNMVVNYTPDVYDRYNDMELQNGVARFAVGNTAMLARTGYRGVRTLNGVRRKYVSPVVLRKRANLMDHIDGRISAKLGNTGYARRSFKRNNKLMKNEWLLSQKAAINYQKGINKQNLSHSAQMMVRNQYRRLSNQMIHSSDTYENRATGLVMKAAPKVTSGSIHAGWKASKFVYTNRHHLVRSVIQTPVNWVKGIVSTVVSVITSIPALIGTVIAILPVIIIAVCFIALMSVFTTTANFACGQYEEIKACDTGNAIKDVANESAITSKNSEQYKLFFEDKYGKVEHDDWGLAYIEENGVRYYCNALATYYTSTIGSKFKITLDSGTVIYTITCDIKADNHTVQGNNDPSPNCKSRDGSMLEFYGKANEITIPKLRAAGFGSLNNNLDEEHQWKGAVEKIEKIGVGGACEIGGILEAEGVKIDFNSKYYTYNADRTLGNPNVCAVNKPGQWWPYGEACTALSTTGKFNKMICSSYAAGRYWEVNYHDDPYPLPLNWDQLLTINKTAPGSGAYSRDVNHPIPKSIVSITFGSTSHDAFIEGVGEDGSVLISECNVTADNEYGFRVRKYSSLQEYLNQFGSNTVLNGMYGK